MKLKDLIEGSVTQIKRMIDVKTGEPVMVNMDKAEPVSLLTALGDAELDALTQAGLKLYEKPGYWEDFASYDPAYQWNDIKVKRAERLIGPLPQISGESVYGGEKPKGPLATVVNMPDFKIGILKFKDGTKYVVDTWHARSYIRMWAQIL